MRTAVIALTLAALAACDDSSSPTIDDPATYIASLRAAECEYLVRCHVFADAAQCADRIDHPGLLFRTWRRPPGEVVWADHVAGGTMSFDAAQAGACVVAIRRGVCAPEEHFPSCWKVFRGIAPAGATTSSESECADGFWSSSDCDGACCTGTCGAGGPPIGHPTTIDGIGDFCGLEAEGIVSCPSHLACRDSTCVLLAAGDSCTGNGECPAGLVCDGQCRRRDALGDRCSRAPDGDSCSHVGAWCADDGRCQPVGLEGDACDLAAPCRDGLHCDPAAGRCIAVYAEGEACGATSAPCDAGLECRSVDGEARCAPTGVEPPVCD